MYNVELIILVLVVVILAFMFYEVLSIRVRTVVGGIMLFGISLYMFFTADKRYAILLFALSIISVLINVKRMKREKVL